MFNYKKSKWVLATSFLAAVSLSGCSSNKSTANSEPEDKGLISTKTDKQEQNLGADQASVYSARSDNYNNQQEQSADADIVDPNMREVSPISQTVTFKFDSAELTSEAKDTLRRAFEDAQSSVPMEAELVGYSDSQGPENYNEQLSERRAQSVKQFISGLDINVNEWQVEGRGEASPAAPNDSADGRAQNRRVSVTLRPAEQHSQQVGF